MTDSDFLTTTCYSYTKTCAFWDIEDFPVPPDGDLYEFETNLDDAIRNTDGIFRQAPIVKAYSARQTDEVNDKFRAADIFIVYQEDDKRRRLAKMLLDIDHWARNQHTSKEEMGENTNVLVIAKDVPDKDSLFLPLLKELDLMHYNIILVVPDEGEPLTKEVLSIPPCFVWTWGNLFSGKPCIEDEDYYEPGSDE